MKSIWPAFAHIKSRSSAFTLVEMLMVISIIGILAALLLAALSHVRAKGRNTACVSQLRQLGIATRLYAEDNSAMLPVAERLPSLPLHPDDTLPRICDVLAPFIGKTGDTNISAPLFKCPADREEFFEVEGSSYMWNINLNGKRIDVGENRRIQAVGAGSTQGIWGVDTNLTHSADSTPLLSDYDNFHSRPPKSGKNMVFMDGHVAPPGLKR